MDARAFYDGLGDDYDVMVSWEERLAREESFLRGLFAERGATRVLDAGCGTGMHAVAFARWGLQTAAADLSPAMVARARENARATGAEIAFAVAGFGEIGRALPGPFDAVTCLGNSLPHLLDDASLAAALADFAAVLVPGGVLVIQNRNYDRLLREKVRFMPLTTRADADGETIFLRVTDFLGGERLDFTIVTLKKRGGVWGQSAQTTPLRAIRRETLARALAYAGFPAADFSGNYARAPFDSPGTGDLLAVAAREGGAGLRPNAPREPRRSP